MITSPDQNLLQALEERLGFRFSKPELLLQAVTHKSFFNENPGASAGHNEVLEFLGDAVLDLSLGHYLITAFPSSDEGGLSKKRASLVNEITLSEIAVDLGFENIVLLGRGEKISGGSKKPRLLAASFEAVIGAMFLDQGFDSVQVIIHRLFSEVVGRRDWTEDFAGDYKTRLQEKIQSGFGAIPQYVITAESGPDHDKRFDVEVRLGDKTLGVGHGQSKKQAEQEAAKQALTGGL